MTDKEYVKSIFPYAICHKDAFTNKGFVVGRTHHLFLDFQTLAKTSQQSWKICAELIRKHLPDLMLEKLKKSYDI